MVLKYPLIKLKETRTREDTWQKIQALPVKHFLLWRLQTNKILLHWYPSLWSFHKSFFVFSVSVVVVIFQSGILCFFKASTSILKCEKCVWKSKVDSDLPTGLRPLRPLVLRRAPRPGDLRRAPRPGVRRAPRPGDLRRPPRPGDLRRPPKTPVLRGSRGPGERVEVDTAVWGENNWNIQNVPSTSQHKLGEVPV